MDYIIYAFPFAIIGIVLTGSMMWIMPVYRVWSAHKRGEADLARAQNEQQIQVAEAKGRVAAADLNKQAAIIEAEAVAEQIKRIGVQLTTHDLYLRWQWIRMMEERDSGATIYVPTEANIPIMEATRRAVAP